MKLFRDILRHRRISLGLSIYTEEQMIRVDPEQMSKTRNSILPEKKDPDSNACARHRGKARTLNLESVSEVCLPEVLRRAVCNHHRQGALQDSRHRMSGSVVGAGERSRFRLGHLDLLVRLGHLRKPI